MPNAFRTRAWLLLAATITLQLVILRSARVLEHHIGVQTGLQARGQILKTTGLLSLPYDEYYFSVSPALRPLVALGLLFLLAFLFSFIGISASDFFCPNLSTIASYLGLSESTAGVTFLAFGNGSPDVFSTFAALRGGTFGLSIGELIGAASFITSIVVGSIAFIRPFHVPRHAFIRDLAFFLAAVLVLIMCLHDGHLTLPESGAMVALYILYVAVVVLGNMWSRRRRTRGARRGSRKSPDGDEGFEELDGGLEGSVTPLPTMALPSPSLQQSQTRGSVVETHIDSPAEVSGISPHRSPSRLPSLSRLPSHTHAPHILATHLVPHQESDDYSIDTPRAAFSLLGAIEFRDVVNSLRKTSGSRSPSPGATTPIHEGGSGEDYFSSVPESLRGSSSHEWPMSPSLSRSASRATARGRRRTVSYQPGFKQVSNTRRTSTEVHDGRREVPPSVQGSIQIVASQSPHEPNPWRDQVGLSGPAPQPVKPDRPRVLIPPQASVRPSHTPNIPSISITDPSGLAGAPTSAEILSRTLPASPNESRSRLRRRSRVMLRVLFPSLQSFRHKSVPGMIIAVFSVPAILALTLTLPVVDDGRAGEGGVALPVGQDEPLLDHEQNRLGAEGDDGHHGEEGDPLLTSEVGEDLHFLVEAGFSPLHSPLGRIHHHSYRRTSPNLEAAMHADVDLGLEEDASKEMLEEEEEEALKFHPVLAAVHCVFGPTFCSYIVFSGTENGRWIVLAAALTGIVVGIVVLFRAKDGTARPWRLVRCFAGFICSMVWIAAIADEVVSVLLAVGEILGLSDAIIGLTIFAVGNSLADLVANVTVAQFAPAMAYAACFGGPMLNLLLGVGGSGTYHMLVKPHAPVVIDFSPTLWVSAAGLVLMLVATAVFVPLNGYLIDRRWATCLIAAYVIVMCVNVGVEITTGRD